MSELISAQITSLAREIRVTQGITRDELAAAVRSAGAPASFTTAVLRNLEIGRRAPTLDELIWLAHALQVPVRQLLGSHAALFGADAEQPTCGNVEAATRKAVQEFVDLDGHQLALAESAYVLARTLDDGAGMAAAAVAKQHAAALKEIRDTAPIGDGDEDPLGAE